MPDSASDRHWGIGQLLMLLVLFSLAPFVILEVVRGVQDVARTRAEITARALGQAEEEAETMTDFLRYNDRYISTLAASPAVRSMEAATLEETFHIVEDLNPNYINVFLVSITGRQVVSTSPEVSDPAIWQQPYFRDALTSGRVEVSGVLAWPDTGRSAVVFAKRVTGEDGEPVGVLCIALNLARLSSVIGFVDLPDDSIVTLIQRDGTVIAASTDPETWVGKQIGSQERNLLQSGILKGSAKPLMPDGTARVTGFATVAGAPWLIIAGIPESEVSVAMRNSLILVSTQFALAALGTVVLAMIVMRRVVMPVRILSDGARAFAAGFLDRRIPLQRRDELGELAAALNAMATDLTSKIEEREAHARALEELNRLQSEFVATASHELRTPVTSIRTYAEALLRPEITDPETRQECIEGIDRASGRLARLAQTLLDVSRIDRGLVQVEITPVAIDAVARAAVNHASAQGDGEIHLEIPAGLPRVLADADRLEDVLANLIGNARKFSPPGAPVTVRAGVHEDTLVVAVVDQGPGIPAAEQERIFERFYQVQRGRDRQVGGSGLGLYISRGYITAMGGKIWVESVPGQGSTFAVSLPLETVPQHEEPHDRAIAGAARR